MSFGQEVKDFVSGYTKMRASREVDARTKLYNAQRKKVEATPTKPAAEDFDYNGWRSYLGQQQPVETDDDLPDAQPSAPAAIPAPTMAQSDETPVQGYSEGGAVGDDTDTGDDGFQQTASAIPVTPAGNQSAIPTGPSENDAPAATAASDGDSEPPGWKPPAQMPDSDDDGDVLGHALDSGMKTLMGWFGLGGASAVPAGVNPQGKKMLMDSTGRISDDDMASMKKAVDPKGELDDAKLSLRVMDQAYKYYMVHGDEKKANATAAMLIQYSTYEASKYGADALDKLQKGDMKGAVASLVKGDNSTLSGNTVEPKKINADGSVDVKQTDTRTGKVLKEGTLSPQQLYQAALGLKNKSLTWQTLMATAAAANKTDTGPSDAYVNATNKLAGVNPDGSLAGQDQGQDQGQSQPAPQGQAIPTSGGNLPNQGALPGELHLNPAIAPKVNGGARPLAPGEYVKNPDGSWSSEISASVADPALNNGQPTNVPTLWLINGKPTRVSEDQAAQLAAKSGLSFPAYKSMDEADAASQARENQWQGIRPEDAGKVAPLWNKQGGSQGGPSMPTMPTNVRPEVASVINQIPPRYRQFAVMMAGRESNFDPSAKNPRNPDSTGLFQMSSNTYQQATGRHPGASGGDERLDPAANARAFVANTQANEQAYAQHLNAQPTAGDLAVMHQQGATGGLRLLMAAKANPQMPAAQLVGVQALQQNGINPHATAEQAVTGIKNYYFGIKDGNQTPTPQGGPAQAAQSPAAQPRQVGGLSMQPALPEDAAPAAPKMPTMPAAVRADPNDLRGMSKTERAQHIRDVAGVNANNQKAFQDQMSQYRTQVAANKTKPDVPLAVKDRNDALAALEKVRPDPTTDKADGVAKTFGALQPDSQSSVDDIAYDVYTSNGMTPHQAYQVAVAAVAPGKPTFTPYEMPNGKVRIVMRSGQKLVVSQNTFDAIAATRGAEMKAQQDTTNKAQRSADRASGTLAAGGRALKAAGNIAAETPGGVVGAMGAAADSTNRVLSQAPAAIASVIPKIGPAARKVLSVPIKVGREILTVPVPHGR